MQSDLAKFRNINDILTELLSFADKLIVILRNTLWCGSIKVTDQ